METRCDRRAGRYKAHASGDQGNAEPARGRDFFMKTEVTDQSDQYIRERCGWQYVSEISPRKRGHITSEEGQQEKDSQCNPGVEDGEQQTGKIVEGKAA